MLAAVALLWGASFLFIKVAVRELQPATLILGRLGLATVALALVVPLLSGGGTALCYAVGQLLAGRHLGAVKPPVVALATTGVAALAALPAGIAQAPHHAPHWKTIGAVVALAVPLTAVAFLLFYAIIAGVG